MYMRIYFLPDRSLFSKRRKISYFLFGFHFKMKRKGSDVSARAGDTGASASFGFQTGSPRGRSGAKAGDIHGSNPEE